jgi:hypothetical protein
MGRFYAGPAGRTSLVLRILPAGFSLAQEAGSKPEVRRAEGQRQTGFVFGHYAEPCFKFSQAGMGLPRLGDGFERRRFPVAGVARELSADGGAVSGVLCGTEDYGRRTVERG